MEQNRKWLKNETQYGFTRFFVHFSMLELVFFALLLYFFDANSLSRLDTVSIAMDVFSLVIGTILLYSCYKERYLKNQANFIFSELLFWLNIQFLLHGLHLLSNGTAELRFLVFGNSTVTIGVSILLLNVFFQVTTQMGGRKLTVLSRLNHIFAMMSALLLLANIVHNFLFYVDENGVYHRMEAYALSMVPSVAMMLCIIANIWLQKVLITDRITLTLYIILPYLGNLLYSEFHFPFIQYQCALGVALFIYVKIFVSRTYSLAEQTRINTKQQTQLMTSQIQPHFIFNALSSIRQVSKDKVVADLILDFSNYLRMNLETMTNDACVPFEKELEHTKQYLRIEELRFGDRLSVAFDLKNTDFEIPPLTLQPIVENAIKHGICERIEGGHLTIISEQIEDKIVITVKDDGVGFDVNQVKNDGKVHVGIENVRARLERMVDGKLEIESELGTGTEARIVIPFH